MSKITNDDLTQSGTGCFIAVPNTHYGNSGRKRDMFVIDGWASTHLRYWGGPPLSLFPSPSSPRDCYCRGPTLSWTLHVKYWGYPDRCGAGAYE